MNYNIYKTSFEHLDYIDTVVLQDIMTKNFILCSV